MNANELRIGNLVEYDGLVLSVLGVSESDVEIQRPGGYASEWSEWVDLDDCKPIPLTEEWLLRMGFIDESDSKGEACMKIKGHGKYYAWEFILPYDPDYMEGGVGFVIQQWQIGFENEVFDVQIPTIIYHVHQLQNLYFALTGEELEIKEQ